MIFSARHIYLSGIVQGVGFRPYVYKLAEEMGIKGWVSNTSQGVEIHAEGENLERFYQRLLAEIPSLAMIHHAEWQKVLPERYRTFAIIKSMNQGSADSLISPDIATCPECLQEIFDPEQRRYHYPFTNCTNCGPRYTIIRDIPYDRKHTTMSAFALCPDCAREFQDPADRRFHAQPVACPRCGPQVELFDGQGNKLPGWGVEQLEAGAIIAVKGLGGFHLVCDAKNPEVVKRLRARKERGAKPFALMVRDIQKANEVVRINEVEAKLLQATAAPIVILPLRRALAEIGLSEDIAPGLHTLGLMLPYTPLHHLLFTGTYDYLVMTSANLSGRPLLYRNEDAIGQLRGIADYFLLHDREIFHPCDDSVVQVIGEQPVFFRRARGYVPLPVASPVLIKRPVLGVGGEIKNAFCLAFQEKAFVSQHIGDIEGYENYERFLQEMSSFQKTVNICPEALAYDAHPGYQTAVYAQSQEMPKTKVYHHHAHLVSVLGEHGRIQPTLGVICDGTGYGGDGKIWGFEFLYGNAQNCRRLAHLEYLPLPGGDAGSKYPQRIAYAYAKYLLREMETYKKQFKDLSGDFFKEPSIWQGLTEQEIKILNQQLEKELQVFWTSSAGRLFDAVSGLLGVCLKVTYEGQAAIELESAAVKWLERREASLAELIEKTSLRPYGFEIQDGNMRIIRIRRLFSEMIHDMIQQRDRGEIALKFHLTIVEMIIETVKQLDMDEGIIVISGGVFQNKLLTECLLHRCRVSGIETLRAVDLPPGDGGIAYGQILILNEVYAKCV